MGGTNRSLLHLCHLLRSHRLRDPLPGKGRIWVGGRREGDLRGILRGRLC